MIYSFSDEYTLEAGCDEAGRGCLAGPVFAAAVILKKDFVISGLNDSKKISEKKRLELRTIIEREAISWAVASLSPSEIDQVNILNASIQAMQKALQSLHPEPHLILVDGNRFKPYKNIGHQCIIKGDSKYASIAAASILAKTYRDEFMLSISDEFPIYQWNYNKGYPTKDHIEGLRKLGPSLWHRKSFVCKSLQVELPFEG